MLNIIIIIIVTFLITIIKKIAYMVFFRSRNLERSNLPYKRITIKKKNELQRKLSKTENIYNSIVLSYCFYIIILAEYLKFYFELQK